MWNLPQTFFHLHNRLGNILHGDRQFKWIHRRKPTYGMRNINTLRNFFTAMTFQGNVNVMNLLLR